MNRDAILALVDRIVGVPEVPICFCGREHREHVYWEDRIYDYNGYRCPDTGREYAFDRIQTATRHRNSRADILEHTLKGATRDDETAT